MADHYITFTLRNNYSLDPVPYSYVDPQTSLPVAGTVAANSSYSVAFIMEECGPFDLELVYDGVPYPDESVFDFLGCDDCPPEPGLVDITVVCAPDVARSGPQC